MTDYTDDALLKFSLDDPELEQHRNFLLNARRQARHDFIGAHVTMMEWQTAAVDPENPALNAEGGGQAGAAAQRKENCRTRYAELDRILSGVPKKAAEAKQATTSRKPADG
jgi:hypothetical protein